ncbi:hypothetical protein OHA72_23615 [Dactylosporangium sp. NBC_01737]|uniref:hypothetical protein n=1 Tax=Dactylosporangium sp. NBC_01737 TaxID=2975959 RepID=UPI002E13C707|nr:hypothetical protein OHA72_23615 [Dactylosporangium sp. NBC_01737]
MSAGPRSVPLFVALAAALTVTACTARPAPPAPPRPPRTRTRVVSLDLRRP